MNERCVRGCCETQAEHFRGVRFLNVSAGSNQRERKLARNRDAYKRLRGEGLQPIAMHRAARMEATAEIPQEIEQPWGQLDKPTRKKVTDYGSDFGLG